MSDMKSNFAKRNIFLAIALLTLICLVVFSAGHFRREYKSENVTEVVTLNWYIDSPWFVETWGADQVSQKITEDTGISIHFITPVGSNSEMLESLILGDDLPDIITVEPSSGNYASLVNQQKVYSLNQLARLYAPDFFRNSKAEVRRFYEATDGDLYAYPNATVTAKEAKEHDNLAANLTFLVRKDIYEALGCPDMTTPEGFRDAVERAMRSYGTTEYGPLIPIDGTPFTESGCYSFDEYLQSLLAIPYEVDGEYHDRNTDPEYIRWLKVFRQLGQDGYMPSDVFLDQRIQTTEKVAQGRYFCMIYQRTDIAEQQALRYSQDPDSVYIAVDGPRNSSGDDPQLPLAGLKGWMISMIPKSCSHPDLAISLFSYLLSEEGQKLIYLGVEGKAYEMDESGHIIMNEEADELRRFQKRKYNAVYGGDDTFWMLMDNVVQQKWAYPLEEPVKQTTEWTYPYSTYTSQYDVTMPENSDLSRIERHQNILWGKTLKELLLAESEKEFDSILADYKEERLLNGYERLMEEKTKKMIENKVTMGVE